MGDTKNLQNQEAIKKMKELAEGVDMCMFCTGTDELPFSTRPMSTQTVDEQGNFWFMSNKDSHKNQEISTDSKVQLIYSNPGKSEFLSVAGNATVLYDKAKIDEFWNPIMKAWFQGGKDDPNITLVKVRPLDAHYWDTKNGKFISLLKIAAGAVVGKEMDGGVEGNLDV